MRLRTAARLQKVIFFTLWLAMLPFGVCGFLLESMTKPCEWVVDWLDNIRFRIGNWLLRNSSEVKDGTICNTHAIRYYTAVQAQEIYEKTNKEL